MAMKVGCMSAVVPFAPFETQLKVISEAGYKYTDVACVVDGSCMLVEYGFCFALPLDMDPFDIKEKVSSYGLKISSVAAHANLLSPAGGSVYGPTQVKRIIKFASDLGVSYVITSEGRIPKGMSKEEAFKMLKFNLDDILKVAEHYNTYICIEPHGPLTTTAENLQRIIDMCDSEYLAINFDTGNTYVAGSDPVSTLKAVVNNVKHLHIKDIAADVERNQEYGVAFGVPIGDGAVDIKGVIKVLKDAQYEGTLIVECAGIEGIQKSYGYLKSLI
jgi:inosose dehydratase